MTLAQMQAYIFNRLGLSTTNDAALLTDATVQLNENVAEIVGKYALKTTTAALTLTAAVATVTLPSDWLRTLAIKRGTVTLQPITEDELDLYNAQQLAATGPLYLIQRGALQIEVVPTPDASAAAAGATIRYVQAPATLSAAGDTPSDIPAAYHRLPCERVVASFAEEEGELQMAQLAEARAERLEQRLEVWVENRVAEGSQDIPLLHYRR